MSDEPNRHHIQFDVAFEWVASHREALPADLAALSAYPMQFRRVIINQVSPEIRAAIWRDHLTQSFCFTCMFASVTASSPSTGWS